MTVINHVFISGGNGEFYTTSDAGESWASSDIPTYDQISSVFFSSFNNGYYCHFNYIGKTTDGGDFWTEQQLPILGDFKKIWFLDDSTGWAYGTYKSLFRTNDAGTTWEKLHNSTGVERDFNQVEFTDTDTGFIAGTYGFDTKGLLYRTFDGGETLEEISIPQEITGLNAMDVISSQEIWIGASTSFYHPDGPMVKIYHSVDQGMTWDTISFGPFESSVGIEAIQFLTPMTGKVLTNRALYSTYDGGFTWVRSALPGLMPMFINMHWVDVMNGFITGLNGELLKTTDGGSTFGIISKGSRAGLRSIKFIDDNIGFACGSYITIPVLLKTSNQGQNWTEVTLPDSLRLALNDIENDGNSIYIASYQGLLLKSDDLGESFYQVQPPDCMPLRQICIPESQKIVAVGYHNLYFSDNGGSTWKQKSIVDDEYYIETAKFISPDTAYVSMRSVDYSPSTGYLLYTTNAGETWLTVNYGESDYIEAMDFLDPLHGTISINTVGVSFTSDGGATWTPAQKISNLVPEFVQYIEDSTIMVAKENWFLAKTTHGNTGWDVYLDHQEGYQPVNAYYFDSPGKVWLVGGGGLIMSYDNSTLGIPLLSGHENKEMVLYPNPAYNRISINTNLQVSQICIYNLQGKLMKIISKQGIREIDISELVPGYYTIVAETQEGFYNSSFIRQ